LCVVTAGCRSNQRGLKSSPARPSSQPPPPGGSGGGPPPVASPDASAPVEEEDAGAPAVDGAAAPASLPDAATAERPLPPDVRPDLPPPSAELARALSLYLPLDDGRISDASGLGQMVRLRSADPLVSWTDGQFGTSLELAGGPMGGYLQVDASQSLIAVRTEISVAAWLWIPADSADGVILSRRATGTSGYLYTVRLARGRLNAMINSANGYRGDVSSPAMLPRSRWVHVAMTFDSSQARLYVDGKPAGQVTYMLSIPPDTSSIVIGGAEMERPTGEAGPVVGRLAARVDEVALYDRAISASEVAQLASGVRPKVTTPPR
jgi:hypothetical protein